MRRSFFLDWLEAHNATDLSARLKVSVATIGYWRRGTLPRPQQAARIIKLSKGAVSWGDIYDCLLTGKK